MRTRALISGFDGFSFTRTGSHQRIKPEGMLRSKTLYPGMKPKVLSNRLT